MEYFAFIETTPDQITVFTDLDYEKVKERFNQFKLSIKDVPEQDLDKGAVVVRVNMGVEFGFGVRGDFFGGECIHDSQKLNGTEKKH